MLLMGWLLVLSAIVLLKQEARALRFSFSLAWPLRRSVCSSVVRSHVAPKPERALT